MRRDPGSAWRSPAGGLSYDFFGIKVNAGRTDQLAETTTRSVPLMMNVPLSVMIREITHENILLDGFRDIRAG
jgi:hypothetical protein